MPTAIVSVALDIPLNRYFDYLYDVDQLKIGQRVLVPFGNKKRIGIAMQFPTASTYDSDKLKPIAKAFIDEAPLPKSLLDLINFSAQYYQYPVGQAVLAALPSRLKQISSTKSRLPQQYHLSTTGEALDFSTIPKRQLIRRQVFETIKQKGYLTDEAIKTIASSAKKIVNEAVAEGLLVQSVAMPTNPTHGLETTPALNDEQQAIVNSVTAHLNQFKAWLIHGVTGSGKTEVYMQIMSHLFNLQSPQTTTQVLVLVPEINLTPQLESRFRNRFPSHSLVSLHSHLNDSERLHHWQLAQSGSAQIVIGTRLSIFTPMPRLKLIIIDEEHDSSYKQQDSMRYHARDVALLRAKQANIPIVLGSATPALESWHNAKKDKYQRLSLTHRAASNAKLPSIQCIDTSKLNLNNGFSPQLIQALKHRLARNEQSLLFINRRGYAPVFICNSCQWTATCQRCSSRMVVHRQRQCLSCHHCGHETRIPDQCPSCESHDCHPIGQATQRIEETLQQLFPEARIARVDRDTMGRKEALNELLKAVHDNQIDILIGTQMLAKGHDFPNLTLVGVIDTDSALHSPDFRASERLFAQLMQVSGRAGRADKAGEVLIQTNFPFHPLFNALRKQDYASFADTLLSERELMQFPPYSFSALLRAEANQYPLIQSVLEYAYAHCQSLNNDLLVYGPVRPQIERLKGMERGQLIFQSNNRTVLQHTLKALFSTLSDYAPAKKVRWSIDVDPIAF